MNCVAPVSRVQRMLGAKQAPLPALMFCALMLPVWLQKKDGRWLLIERSAGFLAVKKVMMMTVVVVVVVVVVAAAAGFVVLLCHLLVEFCFSRFAEHPSCSAQAAHVHLESRMGGCQDEMRERERGGATKSQSLTLTTFPTKQKRHRGLPGSCADPLVELVAFREKTFVLQGGGGNRSKEANQNQKRKRKRKRKKEERRQPPLFGLGCFFVLHFPVLERVEVTVYNMTRSWCGWDQRQFWL